jgi:hypothetical protein
MVAEKKLTEIIAWLNKNNLRKEALELIAMLSSYDDLRAGVKRVSASKEEREEIRKKKTEIEFGSYIDRHK